MVKNFKKIINQDNWDNTLLMLFGGDGSLNKVINEIITSQIKVKLLPIPCGTSNVFNFATQINIKNITDRINNQNLQAKQYQLGEVELENGKVFYFFSISGIGFDAYVVEKLHRMRREKLYIWSYITLSFEELILKEYKASNFRIFLDTKIINNVFFAIIFNINAYGGPFHFANKKGSCNTDFLYLVKFENMGASSIPYIYGKALLNNLKLCKDYSTIQFMEVFIEPEVSSSKIPVHTDGDPLYYLPVAIRKSEKTIVIYS